MKEKEEQKLLSRVSAVAEGVEPGTQYSKE
jgi:hypothetical protein